MAPAMITTADTMNQVLRWPTKSIVVSPWYSRWRSEALRAGVSSLMKSFRSCGSRRRGRVQPPGDAHPPGLGEEPAAPEQHDHRPGEEVGGEDVEQGAEADEEGEAPDRAHAQDVEHHGADDRGGVGGQDRPVGPGEAAVHRRPDGLARTDLVLQPLEVHDIGID